MNVTDQRAAALEVANQTRIERSDLRKRVGAGEVTARRLLEVTPIAAENVEVFAFLLWLPLTGRTRALKIQRRAKVPGHRRLVELTDHQRAALVAAIEAGTHPSERGLT